MGAEKRRYSREETDIKLSLILEHREVAVNVRNISKGGALVQVEAQNMNGIAPTDVGRIARLRTEDGHTFTSPRGTILRCVEEGGTKYVALAFTTGVI
jgi:hypothetical protein